MLVKIWRYIEPVLKSLSRGGRGGGRSEEGGGRRELGGRREEGGGRRGAEER